MEAGVQYDMNLENDNAYEYVKSKEVRLIN